MLTLSTSLANGLAPMPGTPQRDSAELVQRTTDAVVHVTGDDALDELTQVAPMANHIHRRTT